MTISLSVNLAMRAFDSIVLLLPDFELLPSIKPECQDAGRACVEGSDEAELLYEGAPEGAVMHLSTDAGVGMVAHWTRECRNTTLTLFLGKDQGIAADESIRVTVPSAFGLRIPSHGIPEFGSGIVVSARIAEVHVMPTAVTDMQLIGSIVSSELHYNRQAEVGAGKADTMAGIALDMMVRMDLREHDRIIVSLPDFHGPTRNLSADLKVGHEATMTFASWSNSSQNLTFTVPRFIKRYTAFTALLPSTASVILPVKGVKVNQTTLEVTLDAVAGPVPNTSIQSSPPVGSFTNSTQILFDQGVKASEGTRLNLSFTPEMDILENETLTLTLPEFSHEASWNATDRGGGCLSASAYFKAFAWIISC